MGSMKTATKPARKQTRRSTFTPAAWQWDPASLVDPGTGRVQWWSEGGSCSLIPIEKARGLVTQRAAFCGSSSHVCQVHEGIDGSLARNS